MDKIEESTLWRWTIWAANHGFMAVVLIVIYVLASVQGWLDPSIRFATAKEIVNIEHQLQAQSGKYDQINQALINIEITQLTTQLYEMQKDVDLRTAHKETVPAWMAEQMHEIQSRIEILRTKVRP